MKIKTSELIGPALDWAVAQALGVYMPRRLSGNQLTAWFISHWDAKQGDLNYSTNWSHGGPIMEREKIIPHFRANDCAAYYFNKGECYFGPTALVAVMRCYVAFKLGNEVEIPEELL